MFNLGGGEIIVIMVIALIVLGPQRLPDAARQIGKTMSELRRLSTGFQDEVRSALDTADDPNQVAARRNILAKESPTTNGDAPVEGTTDAKPPVRAEPLVAGPGLEPRNGATPATPPKPRPPSAQARAAAKKAAATEKPAPKKAAAKKPTKAAPTPPTSQP